MITIIEISGKYNNAKIFTDEVEKDALKQVSQVLDQQWSKGLTIRVMPDVHVGYGVPIGYTQTFKDKVIPNFVGVDIGCGMLVTKISNNKEMHINYKVLDDFIRMNIPSGFNVYSKRQTSKIIIEDIIAKVDIDRAYKSIGTLGGGNHFIEINQSDYGLYLVIHSGSRHLGMQVANFWTKKMGKNPYLEGDDFNNYIHDMGITQKFASLNRKRMRDHIINKMKWRIIDEFESIHNYLDLEQKILRKGATSALKGERLFIPINMKDGSLIAIGKGNKDWNYSAPHGAGRVMSRKKAKEFLSLEKFQREMSDIWTTSVSHRTLDEAPAVYKPLKEIIKHTKETIEITERLKVLYNFKGS